MPLPLNNYNRSGSQIPTGAHLQEPIDAIREIWEYLASLDGHEEFYPQERFQATIISGFPVSSQGNSADYGDARYCAVRVATAQSNVNDLSPIYPNQNDVDQGIADSLYLTATNLCELLSGGSHFLPTDGTLTVEVFGVWDTGNPQQKHYYFYAAPAGFFAIVTDWASTTYHSSTAALYNQAYAYSWVEAAWTANPTTQIPPLPPLPGTKNGGRFGTKNGVGATGAKDLGPMYNSAELMGNFNVNPATDHPNQPIPINTVVWVNAPAHAQVGAGTNPNPKLPQLPIWIFDQPSSDDVIFYISSAAAGNAEYLACEMLGTGGQTQTTDFAGNPIPGSTVGLPNYRVPNNGTPDVLACHFDEMNMKGWRLAIAVNSASGTSGPGTPQVFIGTFKGWTPDGLKIVKFYGGWGSQGGSSVTTIGGGAGNTWDLVNGGPLSTGGSGHEWVAITWNDGTTMLLDAMGKIRNVASGLAGFTGTGAFTNFTIVNGIITAAS